MTKLKVLVADDEKIIQNGISRVIDWKGLDMEVVAVADDGLAAVRLARELHPDIVITDIKMPGLSGIQVIGGITDIVDPAYCIILSGYNEFEFAQDAMELGVRYYILKPIERAKLESALSKVKACIVQQQETESRVQHLERSHSHSLSLTKESVARKMHYPDTFGEEAVRNENMRALIRYLNEHYGDEGITLRWISRNVIYMNTDYLGKLFKKVTGLSFSRYLTALRIRMAKQYLECYPETKICDCAYMHGFGYNQQYFSRVFRGYTGVSPSEFKERHMP